MNHTRPKIFSVFFLLLFMSIFLMSSIGYAAKIQVRILVTKANIRLEPSTDSTIITSAPRGTLLDADPIEGNWYRVYLPPNASGVVVSGYIHMNLVEVVDSTPAAVQKQTVHKETPSREVSSQPVPRMKIPGQGGMSIGYGFKFGLNMANWYGKDIRDSNTNLKTKPGFITGGFVNFKLFDMFSVQPEILFTQKGTTASAFGITMITKADYVELPVLAKLSLSLNSGFSPNAYIGPAVAIKIRGVGIVKSGGMKEKDNIEDLATLDVGLVLGTGVEYAANFLKFLGPAVVLLDVRYTMGLLSVSTQENVSIRNGVFSILFGLSFGR
jgi:hypothetical protein